MEKKTRVFLALAAVTLLATAAWAGLGLPNEAANPGFELSTGWTVSGPVSQHLAYSGLTPYGVPKCPTNPGSYCGGIGGQNLAFPGGELSQVVDESLYPGWVPEFSQKLVEIDFWYFQKSLADVPMALRVYVDYMLDLSYPDPQSPLYVKQLVKEIVNWDSGGWKFNDTDVLLPVQPRWLSIHFEFSYFSGTAISIIDNVDLQGQCVPEPSSLLALGSGAATAFALVRRKRSKA